jgi:phosphopantothenoylcysteine decarboxylase/phosphopantothenate--cysteine ligase
MNNSMYEHAATQANLALLRERGVHVIDPGVGALASRGEWGVGRLAEPQDMLAAIELVAATGAPRPLDGLRVLVTAGGTREPVDAVRFVGNRSSGRMGFALAEEALRRGAQVTVIAANVGLPRAAGISYVDVKTAEDLRRATLEQFQQCDVLLMAAAVADYRPAQPEAAKIERQRHERLSLELLPTEDVLAEVAAQRRPDQTVIGFAAEYGAAGIERAREKRERKMVDAIVVNDISQESIGFEADENEVTVVTASGESQIPRQSKGQVAALLLDRLQELRSRARMAASAEESGKEGEA